MNLPTTVTKVRTGGFHMRLTCTERSEPGRLRLPGPGLTVKARVWAVAPCSGQVPGQLRREHTCR